MLAAKAHLADIVERIVARYEVGPERARADVDGFVSGLSREKLIAPAEVGAAAETPTEPDLGDDRLPYARPELHSYRDMADLLALDPPTPGALDHLMRGSGEGPRH